MHSITHIGSSALAVPQTPTVTVASGASGGAFQAALAPSSAALPITQGVVVGKSGALGSQVVSTLLQTQDIDQTKLHSCGGGHHGCMKITTSLEAEEASESEEAQLLKVRKALTQKMRATSTLNVSEVDESGMPLTEETEDATDQELLYNKRLHA